MLFFRQMTIFDFNLYRKINREEFTTNCWKTQLTVTERTVKNELSALNIFLRRQGNVSIMSIILCRNLRLCLRNKKPAENRF